MAEAQIHHVNQHSEGWLTYLDNGALVHTMCRPRSAADVAAFALKWNAGKAVSTEA